MATDANIVVIGAGIIGASVAYHLADWASRASWSSTRAISTTTMDPPRMLRAGCAR